MGSNVAQIVDGIIGEGNAKTNALFGDGREYIDEYGNADIAKISNKLKANQLLALSYKQKADLEIKFISERQDPLLLIKITKDALNRLGYNEIFTTDFTNADASVWGVRIPTKFMLDPGSLYTALKESGTQIKAIERTGEFSYKYIIDTSRSSLNATSVQTGQTTELSKPLEPYLIDVGGANKISISAQDGDNWFALVRILDRNLNLISERREAKKTAKISLALPKDAKYITIDDTISLENIKRGLKIYLQ